jgi:hypothetical protein
MTEGAFNSGFFIGNFIDLGEIFDLNNWHNMWLSKDAAAV